MRIPLTLALLAAGITACAPQDDALPLIVSPGPARSGAVGQPFVLDVDVSGEHHTILWSVDSAPEGSSVTDAALVGADTAVVGFEPDVEGVYTLGVTVCDAAGVCAQSRMEAWVGQGASRSKLAGGGGFGFIKNKPGLWTNDRAPEIEAIVGINSLDVVKFDATESTDPDGDTLSYRWSFGALPVGSTLTADDIVGVGSAAGSFTPDMDGDYIVVVRVTGRYKSSTMAYGGTVDGLWEDWDPIPDFRAWEDWDPIPDFRASGGFGARP
ncbi:MAG: hypothetical protein RIT28_3284 [Pseudomonadota bacterium]|jgi:hypothetical protein